MNAVVEGTTVPYIKVTSPTHRAARNFIARLPRNKGKSADINEWPQKRCGHYLHLLLADGVISENDLKVAGLGSCILRGESANSERVSDSMDASAPKQNGKTSLVSQDAPEEESGADAGHDIDSLKDFNESVAPKTSPSPVPSMFAGLAALGALGEAIKDAIIAAVEGLRDWANSELNDLAKDVDSRLETLAKNGGVAKVIEVRNVDAKTAVKIDGYTHPVFERVLKNASLRLHQWVWGQAGSGKSTMASQVAKALNLSFYSQARVTTEHQLLGYIPPQYAGDLATCPQLMTSFRRWFQFGGVMSFDDITTSNSSALAAFNEALANKRCAFPDGMIEMHVDSILIASDNTRGNGATADFNGRNKLDAATLNRFIFIRMDIDEEFERNLAGGHEWATYVQRCRKLCKDNGITAMLTPRQTLQGVTMLTAGVDRADVEQDVIFERMDEQTQQKLRAFLK